MSWLGGYKPPKKPSEDPRETKRNKLEAERAERAERAKKRAEQNKQLQQAIKAREEADKALEELYELEPDIFEHSETTSTVDESCLNDTKDSRMAPDPPPPAEPVNYDEANAEDSNENAMENAIRSLQRHEWDDADIKYYFIKLELRMKASGVKKQLTKYQVLASVLPKKVSDEVKAILVKDETDLGDKPYKKLKSEIMKIFGPPFNADFERAMSRVLSGKPSQLCKAIINDMCKHELQGCCCNKWIFGIWHRALPTAVRQAISAMEFNGQNLEMVLGVADSVFMSTRPASSIPSVAAIAQAPAAQQSPAADVTDQSINESFYNPGPMDSTFHPSWPSQQIAATSFYRGQGRGRAFRGGRGGQGRGGQTRGTGQPGRGARGRGGQQSQVQGQSQGQVHPRHKGPRHPDNPPFQSCVKHWLHGKSAHWCQEPGTCPWRDFYVPKANNQ